MVFILEILTKAWIGSLGREFSLLPVQNDFLGIRCIGILVSFFLKLDGFVLCQIVVRNYRIGLRLKKYFFLLMLVFYFLESLLGRVLAIFSIGFYLLFRCVNLWEILGCLS